jgi:hypothetical protein
MFAVAGVGVLLRNTLTYPTAANVLLTVGAAVTLVALAALVRTVLLLRRFVPSLARHRSRAAFG